MANMKLILSLFISYFLVGCSNNILSKSDFFSYGKAKWRTKWVYKKNHHTKEKNFLYTGDAIKPYFSIENNRFYARLFYLKPLVQRVEMPDGKYIRIGHNNLVHIFLVGEIHPNQANKLGSVSAYYQYVLGRWTHATLDVKLIEIKRIDSNNYVLSTTLTSKKVEKNFYDISSISININDVLLKRKSLVGLQLLDDNFTKESRNKYLPNY